MENNNKELDYSRIKSLMNKVNEFVDTLPEELNKENGFSLLVIANDKMNKVSGVYTLLDETDEQESLVQCIDKSISGAALQGTEKYPQEWKILNGIAEYIMRLCAMSSELYNNFKNGVEKFKKDNK